MTIGDMQGQVVLVTGGAGGVGTGICRQVAEAGAKVILTGTREPADLQAAADALPGNGHWGVRVSVTDSAAIAELAQAVRERYGRLDVLVNNAAITKQIPHDDLETLTDELIDEVFRVNWRGPFACVRAFRPLLAENGGGVIVNISSHAGLSGKGSNIAYSSSKAGINAMTLSLARALVSEGIRVYALAPGFVDTGFVSRDPAWIEKATNASIMKTAIPPEALGDAIVALVTGMPYTTGCYVPVDGGQI
jgi:3-oxoacyl-[acyl-carrier protein] reductase